MKKVLSVEGGVGSLGRAAAMVLGVEKGWDTGIKDRPESSGLEAHGQHEWIP